MACLRLANTWVAVLLALAVPQAAAAQEDQSPWLACIIDAGGADLPARMLDDFLASEGVGPAVDGQMSTVLGMAVFECGERLRLSSQERDDGFSYALHALTSQEAGRRLAQMGVSGTFIGEMMALHRESLAGRDVGEAMDQAFAREMARGQIDPQEDSVLVPILVAHLHWLVRADEMPRPE